MSMRNDFKWGFATPNYQYSVEHVPIKGHIPDWLNGTLLRNGPGTFEAGNKRLQHWFDGYAMLHQFTIAVGRVSYRNRYLQSNVYQLMRQQGEMTYSEFATDPCRSLFQRIMSTFWPNLNDNAKVNLIRFANHFIALGETPIQVRFDPKTLAAVGVFSYTPKPTGQMTTAHPHFDKNQMYNLVTQYGRRSHYNLYQVDPDLNAQLVGTTPAQMPAYMHSFGMSQNYAIITEFPLVVNPFDLLLWRRPYIENFKWLPQRGTPITLLNRHTGELVRQYDCEAFFAFHHVNAFEQSDELIVDVVAYPDARIVIEFYLKRLQASDLTIPFGELRRYRLPLKGGTVRYETITPTCIELPHFDYVRHNMDAVYPAVYGVGLREDRRHEFYNQLVRIDMQTGDTLLWQEDDCYPGEPIFVRSPNANTDDDGVLLSVVLDAHKGYSFLLVLDAQTLLPLGRAILPQPVVFGYHGNYYPNN